MRPSSQTTKKARNKKMGLCAVMFYYNLTPKAAAKMLEVISEEKLAECVKAYWEYHERRAKE